MRRLIALWLLGGAAMAQSGAGLQESLQQMAAAHHGKVALYAEDLKNGESVALNADHVVPTASTIKLAVFVEAFHQIKNGKLSLADKIIFTTGDKVPGSGVLTSLRTPMEVSLENAIVLMMIESDNTATNLVIDKVGLVKVNARIAALGLKDTYLYKKVYRPAEGLVPADQKTYGLGKTTPREMAKLMASIERCELGAPELCKRMIEIMKGQQYRNMIPHYIEAELDASEGGSAIANKYGALDESRSDVGIVYTKNGPIVISAYTYENKDQRWTAENEGEQLIAHMAKAIVEAWATKAK